MYEECNATCDVGCGKTSILECKLCGGDFCKECYDKTHPNGVCIHR